MQAQPLEGITVLDFGQVYNGPYCGFLLAQAGARVIKIESLIGETLRIHLYHDKLIGFVGQTQVIELPRVFPETPEGRARRIDYRHVIHSLAAKPQAFRFSNFRDELFPNDNYRQLWQIADQKLPAR